MIAKNLKNFTICEAPDAWWHLPGIAEQRPPRGSLCRLKGTKLCAWHVRQGLVWERKSDLFRVTEGGKS